MMKKLILIILCCFIVTITVCSNKKDIIDVKKNINVIVNSGLQTSSNPFDYIKESEKEYNELLKHPKETFEYSIKDLIKTDGYDGLKSYIEALLCSEINENFEYDFETANDFLEQYKIYLTRDDVEFSDYDKYAISLFLR